MIRLNDAQHRRVKKLIRFHCANNVRGCCLLLDDGEPCVCVQAISYSLLCRYFREAVLPADRELCADLAATADTRKKCELCGKPFPARSNGAMQPSASAASGQRRGVSRFRRFKSLAASGFPDTLLECAGYSYGNCEKWL